MYKALGSTDMRYAIGVGPDNVYNAVHNAGESGDQGCIVYTHGFGAGPRAICDGAPDPKCIHLS